MKEITAEDLEMLQERIDDPDWDISQQNDVWELLPRLLEAVKLNDVIMCAYCGHESPKNDKMAVVEHTMSCEKRPEKKLLEKALEIEDRLYGRIIHLVHNGYHPETCDDCKEIDETLRIYSGEGLDERKP